MTITEEEGGREFILPRLTLTFVFWCYSFSWALETTLDLISGVNNMMRAAMTGYTQITTQAGSVEGTAKATWVLLNWESHHYQGHPGSAQRMGQGRVIWDAESHTGQSKKHPCEIPGRKKLVSGEMGVEPKTLNKHN